MHKLIVAAAVLCALFASGCDRRPTDTPKPKTSIGQAQSPAVQDARFLDRKRNRSLWI